MIVLGTLIGIAAILAVLAWYKIGMAKIDALRDGAEYARGRYDGMEHAATLLESGADAQKSGVHTPSPAALAKMIRAANTKTP